MNAYDKVNWGILVIGSDNIYACESFNQALTKSDDFNETFYNIQLRHPDSDTIPVCWAKVERWEDISDSPHEPEKTDWSAF